jgi:hypothetical protein
MDITELYNALDSDAKDDLDFLAEKIQNGEVILFLGAAVHCSPPPGFEPLYPPEDRPPLGKQLGVELAKGLPDEDIVKEKNLSWVAQYFEAKRDRIVLIEKIAGVLAGKKPSPLVKALAKMNFRLILTTNYDHLYEDALDAAGKQKDNKGIYKPNRDIRDSCGNQILPQTTPDASIRSITDNAPFIYKIHGDIRDVFQPDNEYNAERDAIVVTDEDYIHFILRMGEKDNLDGNNFNPIPSAFTTALSTPKKVTILFIGYSLMDYNLRLLFKSTMWKKDLQYQLKKWSLDPYPDKSIKELYTRFYTIKFIERDAWSVIPYLYQRIFNEVMPV